MALLSDFAIPGFDVSGVYEAKRSNRFNLQFTSLGVGSNSFDVSMQVINVSRPNIEIEQNQLDRQNSRAYVPGKYTFQPLSVTIEDDCNSAAARVIRAQIDKQQSLGGLVSGDFLAAADSGVAMKFNTTLQSVSGSGIPIEEWKYEGCWLKTVDWSELDYADGGNLVVVLTIRFDHVRQLITSAGLQNAILGTDT